MKTYKTIDFYGSLILMISAVIFAGIPGIDFFLVGYFVVGAWQLISVIVHAVNGWFQGNKRSWYNKILILVLILSIFGIVSYYVLFILLLIMLFAAPVMAVYYAQLSYAELKSMNTRPLAQLK